MPRESPDLRLLPLAAAMWVGQAVVLQAQLGRAALALGGMVLVFGVLGGVVMATGAARRPGRAGTISVLLACGLGVGMLVGGLHQVRLHPPVLEQLASTRAVITVNVRITGDPQVHQPADDGGRTRPPSWSVAARAESLAVRGRSMDLSVPVLLRGEEVRDLAYGSTVQLAGRAEPPFAPAVHALALRVLGEVHQQDPPGPIARATSRIRADFRAACAGLSADAGALLLGLAVGDESTLPRELDQAMIRAGLAHLTAVSGSNTSLVAGLALALAVALGWGWRLRVGSAALVLAAYVALVRPQPSVLRAAAMGAVALVALSVGGRRAGAPALMSAVIGLLVVVPQFAVSLGFALSAAATAGLLVVGPPLADALGRWRASRWAPEPIRVALAVACAAHLATLPLAVLMGNGASLVALPANVVVTPLVPIATVLGLAAALVAPFLPTAGAALALAASPATAAIAWVAHTAAGPRWGVIALPEGARSALGVAALLGLAGLVAARGWQPWRLRWVRLVAVLALAVALMQRTASDARWPPTDWLVVACDVGQGDGVLLRAPGSRDALLVDVGPEPGAIADCVREVGAQRLVVLLTHFHADHVDGLPAIVAGWPVAAILTTPVLEPADGLEAVLRTAQESGVPVRTVRAGDALQVGGLVLRVLWPARRIDQSPANNGSVVALVEVPGAAALRVLLTGDIEPEAQSVLQAGPGPGADVVKVPHHGSAYQSPSFAAWTGARIALVTVGRDNDYGHPSTATLDQYRSAGALVGRTDEQGALAITSTDGRLVLSTQR